MSSGVQALVGQENIRTEMKQSNTLGFLAAALAMAQSEFEVIKKDKKNPYYDSMYADLESVIAATRPALSKNSLAIMQFTTSNIDLKIVTVRTLLVHKSGEFIDTYLTGPGTAKAKDGALRFDAQSIGANTTYYRRFAWQSLVGVAAEDDDDGNAGADNPKTADSRQESRQSVAKPSGQGQSRPANSTPARPPRAEIPVSPTADIPQSQQATTSDLPDKETFKGFLKQCKSLADELSIAGLKDEEGKTANQKLVAYILKATGTTDPTFKQISKNQWLYLFQIVGNLKAEENGIQKLVSLVEGEKEATA